MLSSVLTVTQVNTFVKSLIDGDGRLNDVFVQGEISNFNKHYKSGHLYFSLKDAKSLIKAVMFSSSAARLRFEPQDGMKVIVRCRLSVYEATGQYQLYVTDIQPDGLGAEMLAFEQLKEKLASEGLFDDEMKRGLPVYPDRIAVITSSNGAALQDILSIIGRRWPVAEILLLPVSVQGENASREMVEALSEVNNLDDISLVIIGRGGGSYEDLAAFNDEALARSVRACKFPVVSAVGHETDFTICDFVADLRAPTPSAAAELVTPDITDELDKCISYNEYFKLKSREYLDYQRQNVDLLMKNSPLMRTHEIFAAYSENIAALKESLEREVENKLAREHAKLSELAGLLNSYSPLGVISRGYSITKNASGKVIRSVKDIKKNESIEISLRDGRLNASVTDIMEEENG